MWTRVSLEVQENNYWRELREITDGQTEGELETSIYGRPTEILYSTKLSAVIARTKLIPYNSDDSHEFCYICLGTELINQEDGRSGNGFLQSWLYYLEKPIDTENLLSSIATIVENNRDNHNLIINQVRDLVPEVSIPVFTSGADAPFYDTEDTKYHSHTPTGRECTIEGAIFGSNLQSKHSFALECSECGRITTQPEPSSTLHLVTSERLAPMRPALAGAGYWVCNEHELQSLCDVPHLPEREWFNDMGFDGSAAASSNYADENLLVKCNLEWLGLGHPRGEMGVLTCREPEIIDRGPIE